MNEKELHEWYRNFHNKNNEIIRNHKSLLDEMTNKCVKQKEGGEDKGRNGK